MSFQKEEWRVEFFNRINGHIPVQEYLETLEEKYQAKQNISHSFESSILAKANSAKLRIN